MQYAILLGFGIFTADMPAFARSSFLEAAARPHARHRLGRLIRSLQDKEVRRARPTRSAVSAIEVNGVLGDTEGRSPISGGIPGEEGRYSDGLSWHLSRGRRQQLCRQIWKAFRRAMRIGRRFSVDAYSAASCLEMESRTRPYWLPQRSVMSARMSQRSGKKRWRVPACNSSTGRPFRDLEPSPMERWIR